MDERLLYDRMSTMQVKGSNGCSKPRKLCGIVTVLIIVVAVTGISVAAFLSKRKSSPMSVKDCDAQDQTRCIVALLESIPENLTFPQGSPKHLSVFDAWMQLLDAAQSTIYIASSYWTLRKADVSVQDPSSWQGDEVFRRLIEAKKRGIEIKIVQQVSTPSMPNNDTLLLQKMGVAQVRTLDLQRLIGAGILHTKMWLVDGKHFYVGSANLDWRSLTQVKELGLLTTNCTCLATDMAKIFDVYWMLAEPKSKIPEKWPQYLETDINKDTPLSLKINQSESAVYLSSSPPPLCPPGRTSDIDAILDVIGKARTFIHISVMDYAPVFLYKYPQEYWSVIDNALREAAFNRGIQVYLMASMWNHTKPEMIPFLKSLAVLNDIYKVNIEVRLFRVPSYTEAEEKIPFARVQHTKYMVTDNSAYVGTSNWSGDYFVSTGGIGLIINQTEAADASSGKWTVQAQLEAVFQRDWNSNFTKSIWKY